MFWAELLLRKHPLDPLVYSMGKRVQMLHRDLGSEGSDRGRERERPTRWSPRWSVRMRESDGFALDLGKEAVEKNQQANFPDVVSYAYNDRSDVDLLEGDDDNAAEPLDFLDIDVIDTTWMEQNVHFIRHNYFNLNPTLVRGLRFVWALLCCASASYPRQPYHCVCCLSMQIEDIRQIVVHKRRARSRPGVMRTNGNVYIFLVAPAHVKNE